MAKGYVTLPVGYERVDNLPLLIDQLFDTYDEAVEYASSDPTAYVGQIFSVAEDDNFGLYIINSDLSISKVGQDIDLSSTNISTFVNDSGYQTEDEVSEAISAAISDLGSLFTLKGTVDSTDSLPTEDVSVGDVYLVPVYGNSEDSTEVTEYEEYVYTSNGTWELLGFSTSVDLSDYYTKDEVDALITESTGSSYATNVYLSASEDDSFTVQLGDDGECGGYSTGDTVSNTDSLYDILKTLLVKAVSPTYTDPKLSLTVSGVSTTVEVGTTATVTLSVTFTQNDAGDAESTTYYIGSTEIDTTTGTTSTTYDLTVDSGSNTFKATVTYGDGEVKQNNLGEDDATGQITAGTISATKTITGVRYIFYESSASEISATTSDEIRALANSTYVASSSTLAVAIADGDMHIAIAYPTSYGSIASITQATSNLDVKSSFEISTVSVEGANSYTSTEYYVYTYDALAGLNEDTFTVDW